MSKLDFLNAGEPAPVDVEPVSEPVAAEPVQTPEPEPQAVAPPEPVPESKPIVPEGYVPLAVVMDDRDKRKEAERRAAELEQRLQQLQAQPAPDPNTNPEAFQAFREQQTQAAILSTRLDISEDMAREKHGDSTVDAAKEWALQRFAESPAFQSEVLAQRNPYGYAVQAFQRHQALSKLGDTSEVDAFLAWKAAQVADPSSPPAAAPVPVQPAIPPRSIAALPNAGGGAGHVPSGPGQAYANMFGT